MPLGSPLERPPPPSYRGWLRCVLALRLDAAFALGATLARARLGLAAPSDDAAADDDGNATAYKVDAAHDATAASRVRLPAGVDRASLKAKYENGLLVVTMANARKEGGQRQRIAIA